MNYYTDVLKKYSVFNGRAPRKEYWMFVLWNSIIVIALTIVISIIAVAINVPSVSAVIYLYYLAIFLPSLAVSVRRLHDTNHSAWWLLISLVPIIGIIVLIVFFVQDSKSGTNEYGPNPKGV